MKPFVKNERYRVIEKMIEKRIRTLEMTERRIRLLENLLGNTQLKSKAVRRYGSTKSEEDIPDQLRRSSKQTALNHAPRDGKRSPADPAPLYASSPCGISSRLQKALSRLLATRTWEWKSIPLAVE